MVLARKTLWQEISPDVHHGLGRRMIATDTGEVPLLEVRDLVIGSGAAEAGAGVEHG